MPDFGELQDRLSNLAGLDLDTSDVKALLNEGHRDINLRSEWYRPSVTLTGDGEATDFALPETVIRVFGLKVAGYPYGLTDEEEVADVTNTVRYLDWSTNGLWYESRGTLNERQVTIYPTPTDGATILASTLSRPPDLVDDEDEPVFPAEYHLALVDYAAAKAFGFVEDNLDARSYYEDQVNQKIGELRRLTFGTGRQTQFLGSGRELYR